MNVHVYGPLRLVTHCKSVPVALAPGATLEDLLDELVRLYPALMPEVLEPDRSLRSDLPVFINGRNPRLLPEGLQVVLAPGDAVSLFSPVSSGRMNVEVLRNPALGPEEI